jgi:hypothetical protein
MTITLRDIRGETVKGVVYLLDVSRSRPDDASKRRLQRFKEVCGKGCSPRICVAMTHIANARTQPHERNRTDFEERFLADSVEDAPELFDVKDKSARYPIQILDHILKLKETDTPDVCLRFEVTKERTMEQGHILEDEIRTRVKQLEEEEKSLERDSSYDAHDEKWKERLESLESNIRLGRARLAQLASSRSGMTPCSILPF